MDRFVVLSTFSNHMLADHSCGALESQDIPVMLEHVVIRSGPSASASGFRLLVPSQYVNRASLTLERVLEQYNDEDSFEPLVAAG